MPIRWSDSPYLKGLKHFGNFYFTLCSPFIHYSCVKQNISNTVHSGLAEGTLRKNEFSPKLYKSISGKILTNFLVDNMFVAQKLAYLEYFKDCRH